LTVAGWTSDDLAALDSADTLTLAAGDPENPANNQIARDRVEVGMVTVRGGLYVRAYRGATSAWFRAAQASPRGRIWAGELRWAVRFATADPTLAEEIDAAYIAKYGHLGAQAVGLVNSPAARSATVRIEPR
jgi:hypothetical protein